MDTELNQFYQHLSAERGLAPLTVAAYAGDLQDFWQFAEAQGLAAWGALSLSHLQDYLAVLEGRGLSARRPGPEALGPAPVFPLFLQREEKLKANPVELLDSPRLPRRLPMVLGEDEVAALLQWAGPSHPSGPAGRGPAGAALCHRAQGLGVGGPDPEAQLDLRRGGGAAPGQGLQGAGGAHGGAGHGEDRAVSGPGPRSSSSRAARVPISSSTAGAGS